jgi:ABC-type cobalamin/Fe3+-siderophores transport system ATPase subunit
LHRTGSESRTWSLGRHPHQRRFERWSTHDEEAVIQALDATGATDLSGRLVDELSGGQCQRVWLAMVLDQETPLLLLDEPTTFLDIAHQYGLWNFPVACSTSLAGPSWSCCTI